MQPCSIEELKDQLHKAQAELSDLKVARESLVRAIEEAAMHGVAERIDKEQRLNWSVAEAHWYACRATLLELANQLPAEFTHAQEALFDVLTMRGEGH